MDPTCATKTCSRCRETKVVAEFSTMTRGRCGRYAYCRPCAAAYQQERHPDRLELDTRQREKASLRSLGLKKCSSCGEVAPLDEGFFGDPRKRDGKQSHCKVCMTQRGRDAYLRRQYGITQEEFELMLAAQDGRCAICGRPPTRRMFNIDHSHQTHEIRALLCVNCNTNVLPLIEHQRGTAEAALRYLDNPPAFDVIGRRQVPVTNQARKKKSPGVRATVTRSRYSHTDSKEA